MSFKNLQKYYNLIVPPDLYNNEFVRVVSIKDKNKPSQMEKVFYIQSVNELQDIISKYKYNWDLYISLSTVKGKDGGSAEKLYRRQVLFFDFDKKDFPQYTAIKDFTSHIKRKLPQLFNHAIIDSGGGYHFYVATQTTQDTKRIALINKKLGKILDADMNAVLNTQIARIPTSFNHKYDEKKPVIAVANTYGSDKFKPYKLSVLENIISSVEMNNLAQDTKEPATYTKYNSSTKYFCIQKMLAEGVKQGERNFALGRITKYLQIQGYSKSKSRELVKEWNLRCKPSKNIDEVFADFERFWNEDYKLLGCAIQDERKQAILSQYCDRYQCETILNGEDRVIVKGKELEMDNHLLQGKMMRKFSGFHYLILSILHINDSGLTFKQITAKITGGKMNKPCMSYNTQRKVLDELVYFKYISEDKERKFYKLADIKNYGFGYTRFYYSASLMLINKLITPTAYLVYLCLVKNLQVGKSVTQDALSEELNIDKANIRVHIKSLHHSQILQIEKVYSEKGLLCNRYILVA